MPVHEHRSSTARQTLARHRTRTTLVQRLLLALQRWQRRRAIAAFQGLPDLYLESVGIARSHIPQAVEYLFPANSQAIAVPSAGAPGEKLQTSLTTRPDNCRCRGSLDHPGPLRLRPA